MNAFQWSAPSRIALALVSLALVSCVALFAGCSNVPADEAEPTFTEPYRPQFHYTPERNWMNDPNGLVYHDGTYHLFHQYNPHGDQWGHMSWAHATSTDLVHWEHQPVALPEEGNEMIFSGSAVVDHANTSGFADDGEEPPLVAIYTSHYTLEEPDEETGADFEQAQSLAYSTDGGETWTKYAGNPVLDHPDPDFRDPNVEWHEPTGQWIMTVALPTQHKVQFYASDDLKGWTHLSDFGPAGATGGVWECPDLFELPVDGDPNDTRWVLQVDLNPGAVAGGSGAQYFVGDFDGQAFTLDESFSPDEPRWVDYGTDFYATITWNNLPGTGGEQKWVGWMSNWTYAGDLPTAPWRSAQSVPRSVGLRTVDGELRLVQEPVEALQQLREDHVQLDPRTVEEGRASLADENVSGKSLELVATFEPGEAETVGLNVRVGEDERTIVGYDARAGAVFVDRRDSGTVDFNEDFPGRYEAPLSLQDGRVTLHVLVDWSSVEVFANNGARVLTHRIFPDAESQGVDLFAEGGAARLVSLDAWQLRSIWSDHSEQ